MLLYEENPVNNTKEYLDQIDKIENMRNELHINSGKLKNIIGNDAIDGVMIEGNSLDRYEITMLLQEGVTVRGKSLKDHIQAKNYNKMLERLTTDMLLQKTELSESLIKSIHRIITVGEVELSGQYRDDFVSLRTTDRVPPPPDTVSDNVKNLIEQYYRPLGYDTQFERICEFKRNFELVHPFFDGNGRTGRVLMNMMFLQNGYSYLPIPTKDRLDYFDSLEENQFTVFAAPRMIESMEKIREMERDFGREER